MSEKGKVLAESNGPKTGTCGNLGFGQNLGFSLDFQIEGTYTVLHSRGVEQSGSSLGS